MEALSLTSEIVSEPSCSLALTDDSLPDDTHTLSLSALESGVHAHAPHAPLASRAGLAARLQVLDPSATGPCPEAPTSGSWYPSLHWLKAFPAPPPQWGTKTLEKVKQKTLEGQQLRKGHSRSDTAPNRSGLRTGLCVWSPVQASPPLFLPCSLSPT